MESKIQLYEQQNYILHKTLKNFDIANVDAPLKTGNFLQVAVEYIFSAFQISGLLKGKKINLGKFLALPPTSHPFSIINTILALR